MSSNRKAASKYIRVVKLERKYWLELVFVCEIPKTKLKYPEKVACRYFGK